MRKRKQKTLWLALNPPMYPSLEVRSFGWFRSGSAILDHSDYGRSNEPMNLLMNSQGFIGSFDLPWSEWSWITDPDSDHPKGTHQWWIQGRGPPLLLDQNEARKAKKIFLRPPPPYLKVWIRHCSPLDSGFHIAYYGFQVLDSRQSWSMYSLTWGKTKIILWVYYE